MSEDLKMMIYFIPSEILYSVKGEYRHLYMNANLAMKVGYGADRILVLDNGQVAVFENKILTSVSERIELEDTLIDGKETGT